MIEIQNLSAGYGPKTVLRDFSLHVESGQVVAVIGPNGCGKSTMLRCVAGLLAPQGGKIVVNGHDLQTLPLRERARILALLPQDSQSENWSELSAQESVMAGRTPYLPPYGAPRREDYGVV
jgi:ABC-type cobalamin/Fe3+-siderophores transport system ATPase subunit